MVKVVTFTGARDIGQEPSCSLASAEAALNRAGVTASPNPSPLRLANPPPLPPNPPLLKPPQKVGVAASSTPLLSPPNMDTVSAADSSKLLPPNVCTLESPFMFLLPPLPLIRSSKLRASAALTHGVAGEEASAAGRCRDARSGDSGVQLPLKGVAIHCVFGVESVAGHRIHWCLPSTVSAATTSDHLTGMTIVHSSTHCAWDIEGIQPQPLLHEQQGRDQQAVKAEAPVVQAWRSQNTCHAVFSPWRCAAGAA